MTTGITVKSFFPAPDGSGAPAVINVYGDIYAFDFLGEVRVNALDVRRAAGNKARSMRASALKKARKHYVGMIKKLGAGWLKKNLEMYPGKEGLKEDMELTEKAPPGWAGTIKAMKKHMPDERAFALCVVGDTRIPCLDGSSRTVREIAESGEDVWIYGFDGQQFLVVPAVARARFSGIKRLVEIELDNGRVLGCSPDHRWVMRDGSFVEAQDLSEGDAFVSFNRYHCKSGHEKVYQPGFGMAVFTHWAVMRCVSPGTTSGSYNIHHIDGNPCNNDPDNLEWLTVSEHRSRHLKDRVKALHKATVSPEGRRRRQENSRRVMQRNWSNPDFRAKMLSIAAENAAKGRAVARQKCLKITPDIEEEIVRLYQKDRLSSREVGSKLGLHRSTILKVVKRNGIPSQERRSEFVRKIPTSAYPDVVRQYLSGKSMEKVGAEFGVCHATIRNILETEGVRRRIGRQKAVSGNTNHRVVRVTMTDRVLPMYDVAVDGVHTFAVEDGVFSHNSWWMYKKGAEPHYKSTGSTKSKKEPELKKKYQEGGLAGELAGAIGEWRGRRYMPTKAQKKAAWMRKFDDAAVKEGGPSGKLDWDGATHLYNRGLTPEAAARRMYGKKQEWDDLEESVSLPADILAVADYVGGKKGDVSAAELMRRFNMTRTWAKKILAVAKRAFRGAGIPRNEMLRARSDPARYFREKVLPVLEKWGGQKGFAPKEEGMAYLDNLVVERRLSKAKLKEYEGLTKVLRKNKGKVVYANSGKMSETAVIEHFPRTKMPYYVVVELTGYETVDYVDELTDKQKAIALADKIANTDYVHRRGVQPKTKWDILRGAHGKVIERMDGMFEVAIEEELLLEKGKHYYDGKNYYVDTAFLNAIGDTMKGMSLNHMGFGEFSLEGDGKSVEFDRTSGKKFKGQSGRSHQVYDNQKGALVKDLIKQMEKKGKSELVREAVEDDELEEARGFYLRFKRSADMWKAVSALDDADMRVATSMKGGFTPGEMRPVSAWTGTDNKSLVFTNKSVRDEAAKIIRKVKVSFTEEVELSELVREAVEDDGDLLFEVVDPVLGLTLAAVAAPSFSYGVRKAASKWLGIDDEEPEDIVAKLIAKEVKAFVAKIKNRRHAVSDDDIKRSLAKHGVESVVKKSGDGFTILVPKRSATKAKNILSVLHKHMGIKEGVELGEATEKAWVYVGRRADAEEAKREAEKRAKKMFPTRRVTKTKAVKVEKVGTGGKWRAQVVITLAEGVEVELSEAEWNDALKLCRMVTEGLPQLKKKYFFCRFGPQYVVPQVYVQYADVPKGTKTGDAMKCEKQVMLKVQPFNKKGEAQGDLEVKVHYSNQKDIGFKPMKGSVEEVGKHIISFLKKHDAKQVKGGHMKLAASMADALGAAMLEGPVSEDWTDTSVLAWPEEAPEPAIEEGRDLGDINELFEKISERLTPKQRIALTDPLEAGFRSDNQELKRELELMITPTRRFVRALDELEEGAGELVQAAKETERIRRTTGVEQAMKRSSLNAVSRAFQARLQKLYTFAEESHMSAMRLAKMVGISTRRASKRSKVPTSGAEVTATNLVREVLKITANMNAEAREAGELAAVVIREAEKLHDQKSVISGQKLMDRVTSVVQAQLDMRDQVSNLYGAIGGVVKRVNQISKRLWDMREDANEECPVIVLPWSGEETFVISDDGGYSQVNGWLEAVA